MIVTLRLRIAQLGMFPVLRLVGHVDCLLISEKVTPLAHAYFMTSSLRFILPARPRPTDTVRFTRTRCCLSLLMYCSADAMLYD